MSDGRSSLREGGSALAAVRPVAPARLCAGAMFVVRHVVALLLVLLPATGLAAGAAAALGGGAAPLEVDLARAIHAAASPGLTLLFLVLTALGTFVGNTLLTLALGSLLLWRRLPGAAGGLLLAMLGTAVLEGVPKAVAARPRPELFRLAEAAGFSFPSGHALAAVVLYGTVALALWPLACGVGRWALLALAVGMPLVVGLSRVYLGVHYPTDVLAGWLIGLLWLGASQAARRWRRR